MFADVGAEFAELERNAVYVDALALDLVLHPARYDVIVAPNLFGDILSDLAPRWWAGSAWHHRPACTRAGPACSSRCTACAPDLAGTGRANPLAAILTVALMLEQLGAPAQAGALELAVRRALDEGATTPDLGGELSCEQVGERIIENLADCLAAVGRNGEFRRRYGGLMGTLGTNRDVVFLSARRTPFGTFGGSLRDLTANQLGAHAARAALAAAAVEPGAIEHVIFGNALQTSADAIYHARHVGLGAGVPVEVPALTVNRLCGSGFQAIVSGAEQILLGQASVCLCGGAESMSQAPHVLRGARWGALRLGDPGNAFEDLLWSALTDSWCSLSMAQTAEKLADRYGVTREEADRVAFTPAAGRCGLGRGSDGGGSGADHDKHAPGRGAVSTDEHMRPDTTMEGLAALRPYFRKDGLVTAGNASGIGDGAAAMVIADARWAEQRGLKPLGRLVSWGIAGVEPDIMGIGPVPASRQALDRAALTLDQIDVLEINEAFAPQFAAVARALELDPARTNVNGGAIALTHPLAASGARITINLLHELRRRVAATRWAAPVSAAVRAWPSSSRRCNQPSEGRRRCSNGCCRRRWLPWLSLSVACGCCASTSGAWCSAWAG